MKSILTKIFRRRKERQVDFENPDHKLGGCWGNHVSLFNPENFTTDPNEIVKVYGHKSSRPRVGQTLLVECKLSWVMFEFVEVECCGDPPDMFFADVRAIGQRMKAG